MKPNHSKSSGPSQCQLRVGEQMRHIIAQTMSRGHFHQEALLDAGKVTVTHVHVSPDLKNAKAYITLLGGADASEILPALNDEAHMFQKEIARQANLKFTPKVRFVVDESFAHAERIDALLRDVHIPADTE